jgi:hypothetical protein
MPQAQPELKKVRLFAVLCSEEVKLTEFGLRNSIQRALGDETLESNESSCANAFSSTLTNGCLCNLTAVAKLLVFYEDTM